MATVEVTFTPLSAHVRTARLVATAVARRSGVPDALLDEVRLAVGEACSRAVEAHQAACPAEPVRVVLTDRAGRFEVEVVNNGRSQALAEAESSGPSGSGPSGSGPSGSGPSGSGVSPGDRVPGDRVPGDAIPGGAVSLQAGTAGSSDAAPAGQPPDPLWPQAAVADTGTLVPAGFSLAVIAGLADDVQISETPTGTSVRMSWPLSGSLPAGTPT